MSDFNKLSDLSQNMSGSKIIQLSAKIKELTAAGNTIYDCTIGDFDPQEHPIPAEYEHEIAQSYRARETNYPAGNGTPELRNILADFYSEQQGLKYKPTEFLVAGGTRPLLYAAFQVIVNAGETVLFPVPSWNSVNYCEIVGAKAVSVETQPEENFMPSADNLAPYIQEARVLSLCSPLNPTGTVFSEQQLVSICELVISENNRRKKEGKRALYVFFDQIYWLLTQGVVHQDPVNLMNEMREYTLYFDGISKAFAATGVRCGWAFGPENILKRMQALNSHIGAWAPKPEQLGFATYISDQENFHFNLKELKEDLKDKLTKVYQGFQILKIKEHNVDAIKSQGALYVSIKIDCIGKVYKKNTIKNLQQQTELLMSEAGLGIVPFSIFGTSDIPWYRLSVGAITENDIEEIFVKLEKFLNKLS